MEKKIMGTDSGGGGGGGGGGSTGQSIAERRCGFKPAARLNTARFRSGSPLSSPAAVWSPHLTIPPGLSPAALLDSPVTLTSSAAQPSPTTGTFQLPPIGHEILAPDPLSSEEFDFSFMFKTHIGPSPIQCLSRAAKQVEFEDKAYNTMPDKECANDRQKHTELSDIVTMKAKCYTVHACHLGLTSNQTCYPDELVNQEDTKSQQPLEEYQSEEFPSTGLGRLSEDGYNWRKYGQKQVKGSEYPRSYYKCTHPNCQVKKKVECYLDGRIREIVYKSNHNHPKPQPTRRSAFKTSYSMSEMSDLTATGSSINNEGGSVWRNSQQGFKADGLERTSSTSVVTDISDPLSTAQGKHSNVPSDNPELSSTLASQGDDEDGTTQASVSFGDDSEDDETESKRLKKDICLIDTTVSCAVREPRVVIQTVSEVDILDDGYRWRKYGQKVVKGNPNPRSYYKCTSPGCSVRKHVERASHDLKSVITAYEGKHNHEVPVARNNNNMSSACNAQSALNSQYPLALPEPSGITELEPRRQDFVPRFDRKFDLRSEHFIPSYSGSFTGDSELGLSPSYMVQLPYLQSMSLGSSCLNGSYPEAHQSSPISNTFQDLTIPNPPSFVRPSNLELVSYVLNNYGRSNGLEPRPLFGQQSQESEIRAFGQPKQEEDNSIYDTPY